jgi:two-component system, LytTR family, sensor kinase
MNARWRQHELILIAVICFAQVLGATLRAVNMEGHIFPYLQEYSFHKIAFNYFPNVWLPQALPYLSLFGIYILVNFYSLPALRRSRGNGLRRFIATLLWTVIQFFTIAYIMVLVITFSTWLAHPHFFNYGGFQILAVFGYNDQPFSDVMHGYGPALGTLLLFSGYLSVRERIIYLIERPGNRRAFRILIANQFTFFLVLILSVPIILSAFGVINERPLKLYFGIIPSVALLFLVELYWIFPQKGSGTFLRLPILARLVAAVIICSLPFLMFLASQEMHPMVIVLGWAFQLFIITPLTWLYFQQQKDKIHQLRGVEKELATSQANLQFLRSQINPHFLFNALNTLYGTALKEKAGATAEGIQKLGDMMRFMLHDNSLDFIPLSREIENLKNYIAIQKLRTASSPSITISEDINGSHCLHRIAPMLLIPFVENAFKHGISLNEKSWINIKLECDEENIRFEVRNSLQGQVENDHERNRSGIGLINVAERLRLIYGGDYEFAYGAEGDQFTALLKLKQRK